MTDNNLPPVDPVPETPKPATRAWVRVTLFVSLALNIAIIGLVIGVVSMHGRPGGGGDGPPRLRDAGLGPLGAVLSSEQRASLRQSLDGHGADLRRNREQMRGDIGRLLTALRDDSFDATVFEEILAGQRSTLNDRQKIGHEALISAISNASPEQRKAMADKLEKALKRGENRRPKK